jgi:Outer membrane protein beta-barrel domain
MKKAAMLLTTILALAAAGSAAAKGLYVGAKAGVNLGDVSGSDAFPNTKMRTGFLGGGFVGCDLNDQFGVRGEVMFDQKGVKDGLITTVDGDQHPGKASFDYVDVPIVLDAKFPAGDRFGFDLFAGPSFNFLSKSEVSTEDGNEDRKSTSQSFEFGAVVGGGARVNVLSVAIVADVRYDVGATKVYKSSATWPTDMKNRGIGFAAGLEIPLGSR